MHIFEFESAKQLKVSFLLLKSTNKLKVNFLENKGEFI